MRARHCLQRAGIVTIGDLMQYSDKELLEIRYLGYTILNEIRDKQREHYSKLRTDVEISLMGDTVDDPAYLSGGLSEKVHRKVVYSV